MGKTGGVSKVRAGRAKSACGSRHPFCHRLFASLQVLGNHDSRVISGMSDQDSDGLVHGYGFAKELSERRKKGREKDSNLLREAAGFVERFRPEMVLSENVSGIGDPKYGGVWDEFRTSLEALGYVTGSQIVCTSKFGVPQVPGNARSSWRSGAS